MMNAQMESLVREALKLAGYDAQAAHQQVQNNAGPEVTPQPEAFVFVRRQMAAESFQEHLKSIPVPELANRINEVYIQMGELHKYLDSDDESATIQLAQARYKRLNPSMFKGLGGGK